MPYFVVLSTPANNPGAVTASVVGPMTEDQFFKTYNVKALKSGPNQDEFATKALAQASADKYNKQPTSQKNVGSQTGAANAPSGISGPTPGFTGGIANPLNDLNSFFSNLSNANTWLRVGEVVLGIVLIAVGLARMTNAVPIATSIAKAVK